MSEKSLCVWDVTLAAAAVEAETLRKFLPRVAKKWCFQTEKAPSGYVHYQIRLSLIKKKRQGELVAFLKSCEDWWDAAQTGQSMNVSPTSNPGTKGFNYIMKDDTRIDGPWSDVTEKEAESKFLSFGVSRIDAEGLRPWMETILESCQVYDARKINILHDVKGGLGKSAFAEWLEYYDHAYEIPPFRLMEDIMAFVMCQDRKPCYILDLPRGMVKSKMADFISGIECLKNGVAYDKRYHGKKRRQNRPVIWMFANNDFDSSLLTKDRWNYWHVNRDTDELVEGKEPADRVVAHPNLDELMDDLSE